MVLKGLYLIVFNHARYERLTGTGSIEYANPFRKHLLLSLFGSALAIAMALAVSAAVGRIGWSGPVAWNMVLATLGVFFGAWGTWFGVTERRESWKKSLLDERLRDVVFTCLFVPGKLRSKSGLTEDGAALIDKALAGERPLVRVNPLSTDSERSEQKGFANLLRGVAGMFRNTTGHEARIYWNMSKDDAEDCCRWRP